jgi:hypothetical protein
VKRLVLCVVAVWLLSQQTKLSVAFLYDVTISTSGLELAQDGQLLRVMASLPSNLQRGDVLRFGVISNRLHLSEPLDVEGLSSLNRRVPVVPDRDRFGPSPLWDAMFDAVTALAADDGQRALILITDGRSTGNRHSLSELLAHAVRARVSISGVVNDPGLDPRRQEQSSPLDTFASIAEATGGTCLTMSSGTCRRPTSGGPAPDLASKVGLVFGGLRRGAAVR